jgi:hypothetical protein
VLRFVAYERLPLTDTSRDVLSIAAQHAGAPVVRDARAYQATMESMYPHG